MYIATLPNKPMKPKADSSRWRVNEPGPRGLSDGSKAAARPRQCYYRRARSAFAAERQTVDMERPCNPYY